MLVAAVLRMRAAGNAAALMAEEPLQSMNPVQSLLPGVSQQGRCSVFFCLLSPFLAVFSVFLETEVFRDASARPINMQPSVQSLFCFSERVVKIQKTSHNATRSCRLS